MSETLLFAIGTLRTYLVIFARFSLDSRRSLPQGQQQQLNFLSDGVVIPMAYALVPL